MPRTSHAFSYIEMLLIMFIMLIMILMVSYHSFDQKKADVTEANQEMLAVINYYQTLSITTNESVTLSFLPGSKDIIITSQNLGIDTRYRIRNGSIYNGSGSDITFKGDTLNHGATITYFINGERFELIFQLLRGRIRIENK